MKPYGKATLKNGERRVRREVSPRALVFIQLGRGGRGPVFLARRCRKSFVVRSADANDNCIFYYEITEPPDA